MGVKLFDGRDSDNDDVSKIEIDKEFARRFEHNKKREDLQRYEELKKKGLIPRRLRGEDGDEGDEDSEESSSSDDDDDDVVSVHSKKKDLEFFEALIKVRKQDPILKSKDVKLFDMESDSDDGEGGGGNKGEEKKKAMYLKDVVAKHLIEEGPEFSDKEEKSDRNRKKLTYDKEQEEIRKAFLEAVEGNEVDENEDDLLKVKEKNEGNEDESDDGEFHKKLDEYFGGSRSGELDENASFLKEYFMNKMWIDKNNEKGALNVGVGDEELEILSEDEKEIEKQEEYEYRFQENAGDQVVGHSRAVEGTVRKKVKARKEQRKHKEERMEIARLEREEELRHLKNLKKKEMDDRIRKIMLSAGIQEDEIVPLSAKELEEEFDPEEYDRMMKKAFGDNYYEAEDADPEFGSDVDEDGEIEKPDFDKEDELLGLPKGWDSGESGNGFLAARERILKLKMENEGEEDDEEKEDDEEQEDDEQEKEEEVTKEGKRKRKRKLALLEKAKQTMLEEYYRLDYEDTIGDLKTRFKYAKIKSNRYGLSTSEILMMEDKDLNQYVPIKKIAPYKDEWKPSNSQRYQIKIKAKEIRQEKQYRQKTGKKKRKRDDANKATSSDVAKEGEKPQLEESAGDVSNNLSRKARRKQRQTELKLSNSRLMAYGKIESKPKKVKH